PGPDLIVPLAIARYPCDAISSKCKRELAPSSEQPPLPHASTPSFLLPSLLKSAGRYTTCFGNEGTSPLIAGYGPVPGVSGACSAWPHPPADTSAATTATNSGVEAISRACVPVTSIGQGRSSLTVRTRSGRAPDDHT